MLDISGATRNWRFGDVAVLAAWVLVIVLFAALAAGWAPGVGLARLRLLAWSAAFLAGVATAAMIVATSFGSTRDKDKARLQVDNPTRDALVSLCPTQVPPTGVFDGQIVTNTLNDEFVIVDFPHSKKPACRTIRIPRAALIAFKEGG